MLKESKEHKTRRSSMLKRSPLIEIETKKTKEEYITGNSKTNSNTSSGEVFNVSKRINMETTTV